MADARTIARGVFTVTGSRILGLVFTLIQVKLTVTYLGKFDYGLLTIASLFVASFGAWTELGMGNVVVRRVSGQGADLAHTVGVSMGISLVTTIPLVIACIGAGAVMYADQPVIVLGIAILSLDLVMSSWSTRYNPVAQVTHRFGYYAASDLLGRIASLAVIVVAMRVGADIRWFFLAQLMISGARLVGMLLLGRTVGKIRPVLDRREMWSLVRETLPLTYILAVGVLYFTIDGILLSKLSTAEQAGAYGLAYKTVGNATVISAAVASVLAARFAADFARSQRAFTKTLREALRLILVVAVPLATLIWPMAPDLVRLVGSAEMAEIASRPLSVIAVAIAIGMVSEVVSVALISAHQQSFLTKLNTTNLVLNIILNIVLIPRYQATGAAMALLVSEASGLIVCAIVLSRRWSGYIPVVTLVCLVPAVIGALMVEQLLWMYPWGVRFLALTASYAVFAVALRAVPIEEITRLAKRSS